MIKIQTREVYYSENAGRAFLTLKGAANKEATAIMVKKYKGRMFEVDDKNISRFTTDSEILDIRDKLAKKIYDETLAARE